MKACRDSDCPEGNNRQQLRAFSPAGKCKNTGRPYYHHICKVCRNRKDRAKAATARRPTSQPKHAPLCTPLARTLMGSLWTTDGLKELSVEV